MRTVEEENSPQMRHCGYSAYTLKLGWDAVSVFGSPVHVKCWLSGLSSGEGHQDAQKHILEVDNRGKVPLLRLSFGAQLHSNTEVGLFKNSLHSRLQPEVLLNTESRRWEVSDCLTARRAFANKFLKPQTFCTLLCWLRCCFLTALEHMETLIHPTYYAEKLHALGA